MKRKRILAVLSVVMMFGLASEAFATKWTFRSLYFENGKVYAIEECETKFLSTDGCTVGHQRYVELETPWDVDQQ
jgi:hypothetical protein